MTPIELNSHFEQEKTEAAKELFSDVDLKEFTDLVKDDADFAILLQWLKKTTILTEINDMKINDKTGGLKTTIDTEIGKNKDKIGIFDSKKEYITLTPEEKNLYEICVLWAMLKNEKDKVATPDYKVLAKAYYETINPVKVETKVEVQNTPNHTGNFNSWSSDIATTEIKDATKTTIETKTAIEKGKTITAVTATVSAGADLEIMPVEKAKADRTAKLATLKGLESNFNDTNKKAIEKVITDLSEANIKAKIKDESKNSTTNGEQLGNRYLIGARIAQGFIDTLSTVKLDPEPTLTLTIDWDKCIIGKSKKNQSVQEDRFIGIYLTVTKTENAKDQKEQTKQTIQKPLANEKNKWVEIRTVNPTQDTGWNWPSANTQVNIITKTVNTGDQVNFSTKQWTNSTWTITKIDGNQVTIKDATWEYVVAPTDITEKVVTAEKPKTNEKIEIAKNLWESPDIFIEERIRISLSKDFKRNNKPIDKDKDIKKITKSGKENQYYITIDDKEIAFSFTKIDKDWNFEKDTEGNVKVKEDEKKYYEAKLETTELKDKFKVYDVKETDKNITTTLNEEKTKEAFKIYYTFNEKWYSLDVNNITLTQSNGDLDTITTNIKYKLPQTILANQKDKTITEDVLENVIFDKNGEIKTGSGNIYEKFTGKNTVTLLTQEKDANDNYKKEEKNMKYNIKLSGKNITIINDEVKIDATTKIADWNDNRMASEVENAEKTQETFKNYTADLTANFKKWQINALGGNAYQLLVIPNITGVDESQYITMKFTYTQKPNTQTQYFKFSPTELTIPEKYKDAANEKYFVIDNLYYKVEIPTGDQTSINPRMVLDYEKTKTEALKKTNKDDDNQINEFKREMTDNNSWWQQDRNIALLNNITYNNINYLDFSIDETEKEISYTREISLDEVLWYDKAKKNKLVLWTIKFDGNGEIIETEDRNLKVNKENQTLEIKNLFGWNKTLTIPFEIKDGTFTIGTNANTSAAYIVEEFNAQKEYLKNRIYNDKATITTKFNEKIKEIGTQRASEFPWLKLAVPKEGKWKESNTPTIDGYQYLNGPTSAGLYYLELNNAYQGKDKREAEFLYFKVSGKDVTLTDMNGNPVEETYIQSKNEYKPGKGLVQIKNDLTITTIKDVEEQEKGYPKFEDEPETVKNYLTKTVSDVDRENYTTETSGKYLRIFGNSKIGHIASIPIKTEEENKNKYLYNKEWLKQITSDEMAKDLWDYDNFKALKNLGGLKESELKVIFMTKFKADKNIDKATNGDNIRIKNNKWKYEYRNISSKDGEKIEFEENEISKEIQEKIIDDMKKDLIILWSIENIKFKYRRNDEKSKKITPWDKAGNWTIKDIEKQSIEDFIKKETIADKKITLQLLGPAQETITLDINDGIYEDLQSKDLKANGYHKNLFESRLSDGADKEATVQNEKYKAYLQSNEESKEYRIIFESQVESGNQ